MHDEEPPAQLSDCGAERLPTLSDRVTPSLEVIEAALFAPQAVYIAKPPPLANGRWRPPIYDGGVYRADGSVCEEARHAAFNNQNIPASIPMRATARRDGTWLYGGLIRNHFGHFLTECIGRLWGAGQVAGPIAGLLFTPLLTRFPPGVHPNQRFRPAPFIRDFLELIGLGDLRVIHPAEITQVERLVVPAQLIVNTHGPGVEGHPALRDFLAARLEASLGPRPAPGRSIYVSRSRLQPAAGAFLQEEVLERNLAAHGYETVHPELMPLREQLSLYRQCRRIIFAEGSAGHCIALAAGPAQSIAMIRRQKPHLKEINVGVAKFERQIRAFGCPAVQSIEAVQSSVTAADLGMAEAFPNASFSVLDFCRLGEALRAGGMIGPQDWPIPLAGDVPLALERRGEALRARAAR